jgi:hypothetical protein
VKRRTIVAVALLIGAIALAASAQTYLTPETAYTLGLYTACPTPTPGTPTPTNTPGGATKAPTVTGTPCKVLTPTITPTPCPTDTRPDPVYGCIPITPTFTRTPCPTDQVPGPTPGRCVYGTAYPFVTPTFTRTPVHLLGDVNCDGYRNAIDAALILQYHARLTGSLACGDAADVNNDAAINSIDALLLLQYVVIPCAPSVPC